MPLKLEIARNCLFGLFEPLPQISRTLQDYTVVVDLPVVPTLKGVLFLQPGFIVRVAQSL